MEETISPRTVKQSGEEYARLSDSTLASYDIVGRTDQGIARDVIECAGLGDNDGSVCEPCCERLAELARRSAWGVIAGLAETLEQEKR